MMDIIGNCLVPHQRCQQLQVGGKVVGVPGEWMHGESRAKWSLRGADVYKCFVPPLRIIIFIFSICIYPDLYLSNKRASIVSLSNRKEEKKQ